MKIILVGSGKVGTALARQLSEEGHNVTVVDTNKARVEHPGVQQRVPALGLFHRVEHPGVDEDALPGPQNELRLVHVHGQRALHRKDELELLMPVHGNIWEKVGYDTFVERKWFFI